MTVQPELSEYCLFLLMYMASADDSFHPAEEEAVRENILQLFPGFEHLDRKLDEHLATIRKSGKENSEKYIHDNASLLQSLTDAQRKSLRSCLFDVLNADGRVNEGEIRFLRILRTYFGD